MYVRTGRFSLAATAMVWLLYGPRMSVKVPPENVRRARDVTRIGRHPASLPRFKLAYELPVQEVCFTWIFFVRDSRSTANVSVSMTFSAGVPRELTRADGGTGSTDDRYVQIYIFIQKKIERWG